MKDRVREALAFQDLTPEEKEKRGILCRLYGPCADIKGPTRNGRKYSDSLWSEVFNKNEIVKELLANGGIPGEAQHPVDREEVDVEKIALMMPEAPKKGEDGTLIAYFDVQDTPCGRILYQLAKYGFKLGISSRGTGDIIYDGDGNECVDPATYNFTCFDAVIVPSVAKARLNMVESLENKKSLKVALNEELERAKPDERKLMESTIKELKLDIDTTDQKVETIDEVKEECAADDNGASVLKDLQESLRKNREYEKQIKTLQEQLSVCYTKEREQEESLSKMKRVLQTSQQTANRADALSIKVETLNEQLSKQQKTIEEQESRIETLQERLQNQRQRVEQSKERLNESLNDKQKQVDTLSRKVSTLQESLETIRKESKAKEDRLVEQIEDIKKDASIKSSEYKSKLANANKLIEKYQRVARMAVDKYIDIQALRLGVNSSEIKNRLSENYSFTEIDKVCEDLGEYKVNVGSLPFAIREDINRGRVKVKESKEPIKPDLGIDDTIDDFLLSQIKD